MAEYSHVPEDPGCYLYKDSKGRVIYIGKAKSLRKRVSSYFTRGIQDPKTKQLVKNIDQIDYLITGSETEALILENNLIKKYRPKYNVNLKDSKRFAYLELTQEAFPRLRIARRRREKGEYYGPFISALERNYIRDLLNKTFFLRTCRRMPKRPCLRHHIRLCKAPCAGLVQREEYDRNVDMCRQVLKGKTSGLIRHLEDKMKSFSERQMFEQAIEAREQINALQGLQERQAMERHRKFDEDIINYTIRDEAVYLMLFNVHRGMIDNKQEYIFDATPGFFEDFIIQYYSENRIPKELILPHETDSAIQDFLKEKSGRKVHLTVPKRGEKRKLLELVSRNIDIAFFGNLEKVQALKKALKLSDDPKVIECFDISHISGSSTAGSMVRFQNGKPDKSGYRRFKVRTVEGIDDFRALNEVVRRRYARLKRDRAALPDLIVVDGGKGQLSASMDALKSLGLKIPMIAIAKRMEEIYFPGLRHPLRLDPKGSALRFLQQIRDEAHRFAINYNRLLRKKELFRHA